MAILIERCVSETQPTGKILMPADLDFGEVGHFAETGLLRWVCLDFIGGGVGENGWGGLGRFLGWGVHGAEAFE